MKYMILKKEKGQGALEYLLLIGGAVLIAVIVIALLVGMGGQSRDSAQEQADRAQQASDIPQPAQIIHIETNIQQCRSLENLASPFDINLIWRPVGDGGEYTFFIYSNTNELLHGPRTLNPNEFTENITALNSVIGNILNDNYNCGDSFYAQIKTEKNNQKVRSQRYRFSWSS